MKKILLMAVTALALSTVSTSCVDTLDDYNIDPKSPTEVPAATLMTNAQRQLARSIASASVNVNPFRLYAQYWAQTTYFDESIYDIQTRAINRTWWNALYRDVLRDFQEAKRLVQADNVLDPAVKANQIAEIEVMEVYAWTVLVNTFGDVPYTQALDFNTPQPKYDDDQAIYADLFRRLNGAITTFDESADSFGDADIVYHGDVASWKKFANSLKLRMAVTVADVSGFTGDGKSATVLAQDAVTSGVFSSTDEEAQVVFFGAAPSTNPVYEDLVISGRKDFVGADTFVDSLLNFNDPRLSAYFTTVPDTSIYVGGEYGSNNSYNSYSHVGSAITDPTLPAELLSYAEVEFLLAEAAERGMVGSAGDAAGHYDAGVTASIERWGGSAADAAAYLAQPKVAYATAPGTFRQKIGLQKWFALYNNPPEAWKEWRRLDAPNLVKPAGALTEIPLRYTYPAIESNLNGSNYSAASAAIGGDQVTSRIFWDKP